MIESPTCQFDFNLQELQLADQYNDEIVTSIEVDSKVDSLQAMPTQPFDIDETLPPSAMPTLAVNCSFSDISYRR